MKYCIYNKLLNDGTGHPAAVEIMPEKHTRIFKVEIWEMQTSSTHKIDSFCTFFCVISPVGILLSVKSQANHKVQRMKEANDHLLHQVSELQEQKNALVSVWPAEQTNDYITFIVLTFSLLETVMCKLLKMSIWYQLLLFILEFSSLLSIYQVYMYSYCKKNPRISVILEIWGQLLNYIHHEIKTTTVILFQWRLTREKV